MSAAFTDAQLIAFLEGKVDEKLGEAIEAAINLDPALAQRVETLADEADDAAAQMVRAAFDRVLTDPVPDHLAAIITAQSKAEVIDFAVERSQRMAPPPASGAGSSERKVSWHWPQLTAMAASLAIGVLIGGFVVYGAPRGDIGANGVADGALVLASAQGPATPTAIAAMLDTAPSGTQVNLGTLGSGEVVLTFRNYEGQLCRQFSLEGAGGTSDALACAGDEDGAWQLEALGRRVPQAGEMQLAGGNAAVSVIAAVDAMIDSDPLVGAGEAAALKHE